MFDDDREFGQYLKAILAGRHKSADAAFAAERIGASLRVRSVIRALAGTVTPGSPGWGGDLAADYAAISDGMIGSMRHADAYDGVIADARRVPPRTRVVAVTVGAEGSSPAEGGAKTISQLELAGGQTELLKATVLLAVSEELVRTSGEIGTDFLTSELRGALAVQTDLTFLGAVTQGLMPIAASGTDASAVRHDIQTGLAALALGAGSKPHIIVDAATALGLTFMEDSLGGAAFPDMGITGGHIGQVPVHVSDGLPPDGGSPVLSTMVILDADGITGEPGTVIVSEATHATVDLGSGQLASLWQQNLVGLKAERWFSGQVARPGAVALIGGVAYGRGETSP